jgi:DNA-binding response OmpR family regulator
MYEHGRSFSDGAAGSVLLLTKDAIRAGRIAHGLTSGGLLVTVAFELDQAVACLQGVGAQVVVLDLQALGPNPEFGIRGLRRCSTAPLLGLATGDGDQLGRLLSAGLTAVASVQASSEELVAQVHALLGLAAASSTATSRRLRWGPIEIDGGRQVVRLEGQPIALTPLQLRLLTVLVGAGGDVVSHVSLYRLLWRTPVDDEGQRLAAHIHRLRERLGGPEGAGHLVLTVRGAGYRLALPQEAARAEAAGPAPVGRPTLVVNG